MKPGKLIALVVLGALAWQHEAMLREKWELVRHLPDITNTYMEMRGFRVPLRNHLEENAGRLPRPAELRTWLNRRFENPAKEQSAVDYFGNPYRVEIPTRNRPVIRSCGPDGSCGTPDDLVVDLGEMT